MKHRILRAELSVRPLYMTFLLAFALFGGVAGYSQLVANSRYLGDESSALRDWAESLPQPPPDEVSRVVQTAQERARFYDDEIVENHLEDGMVVNRDLMTDEPLDQCDSLLFSSLRFVSLLKLGEDVRSSEAWRAIQLSQINGHWFRHPRCSKSTSRDMILGLLIALSQKPQGFEKHLRALIERVDKNNGYFSTGPVYVSYLSPGLARFVGMMARGSREHGRDLPDIIRDGYSTAELEVLVTDRGYESHLGALTAWLEMEIVAKQPQTADRQGGLLAETVTVLASPFVGSRTQPLRLDWITDRLVRTDRKNLFFRFLRLKAAGALTAAVRLNLLKELLAMPQFPADHLPRNCDRKADYIWQRAYREPARLSTPCTEEYSGTDFLWMTALLLDGYQEWGLAAH